MQHKFALHILFRYKIYLYIAEKMIAQQKHTKKLILFCLMHKFIHAF